LSGGGSLPRERDLKTLCLNLKESHIATGPEADHHLP
jgi:hypothetical protein